MKSKKIALNLIKKHEGLELFPYKCTAGFLTIGYGHNLEVKGITEEQAELILADDIDDVINALEMHDWFNELDGVRQAVIIDMAFNLGVAGLFKFKNMIAAIKKENYDQAANEMFHSKWATQVGGRARTLTNMMKTGEIN